MNARERRKRRRLTERQDGHITFRLLGADPVGLQHSGAYLTQRTSILSIFKSLWGNVQLNCRAASTGAATCA